MPNESKNKMPKGSKKFTETTDTLLDLMTEELLSRGGLRGLVAGSSSSGSSWVASLVRVRSGLIRSVGVRVKPAALDS